jgi:hypothetical protein
MNPNVMAMCPSSATVHLARGAADGAVDLRMKLATELRYFGS